LKPKTPAFFSKIACDILSQTSVVFRFNGMTSALMSIKSVLLGDLLMPGKHKVTGVKPMFGNARSHSLRATRKKWDTNLQNKRIYVPELDRHVRVMITAGELRTIDKIGLIAFLKGRGISINTLL